MTELAKKRCVPCEGKVPPLGLDAAGKLLGSLRPAWKLINEGKGLEARFEFKNYWRTTAFVNAVAWIAHNQDHHPDIGFTYNSCTILWWTHSINGLSENDFICAAKVDQLLSD